VSFSRVDDLVANGLGVPQIIAKDTGTAEAAGQAHTPWYQTGVIGAGAARSRCRPLSRRSSSG
jgi:hypothetical protein